MSYTGKTVCSCALFYGVAALLLLSDTVFSYQSSSFLAGFSSRKLLDFRDGFTTSTSTDVKLVDANIASCDLSLKAHSDNILSGIKNTTLLATKFLLGSDESSGYLNRLEDHKKILAKRGCPASSMKFSIHASFGDYGKTPVTAYFSLDLPALSPLPVFQGELDNTCRVEAYRYTNRLILKNVDLYESASVPSSDGLFSTSDMITSYGAQGILLDIGGEGVIDIFSLLSCEVLDEMEPEYIPLRDGITVGRVREILDSEELSIERNRARSFMVVGFHASDF